MRLLITPESLRKVTFTQLYYTSYPALLVPSHSPTLGQLIRPFLQRAVIFAVVGLVFLLFLVANLVWLIEHKHNPQFPKNYSKEFREAFWFISVTTTTVGYGDKFPVTENGRLVTNIWMWLSLALTSSFTAGLATTFTLALTQQPVKTFNNLQDLENKKVAILGGNSSFVNLTTEYKMTSIVANNLEQAVNLLYSEQVEAVLGTDQDLRYYLKQNPKIALTVVPIHSSSLNYGFVLPQNSPFLNKFNIDLLQMQQDKVIANIINKWMDN